MKTISSLNVVVVGASGTLGSAFAQAAHAEGATVSVAGRNNPALGLPFLPVDISVPTDCDRFADALNTTGKKIDVLLNFVGTHHAPMDLGHASAIELADAFDRVTRVNLQGAFYLTAAIAPILVRQRDGHIIHLCSNASRLSLDGSHAYVATKHGLEGLVKSTAAQLTRYGVRVNGIAPGTVETPLNTQLLRDASGNPSLRAASILAHTPSKRFATIDGIVESLLALCIPQKHLTGNVIFCDDGYAIEGHSWPEGTRAVYDGPEQLEKLFEST